MMTSEGYRQHILPEAVPWLKRETEQVGRAYIFMKDSDPVQTAVSTVNHLNANDVELIPWPHYSADLNLMDNVWSKMKLFILQ